MRKPNDPWPGSGGPRPIALWIRVGVLLFTAGAASFMVLSAQSEHSGAARQLNPVTVQFAKEPVQAALKQADSGADTAAVEPGPDAGARPLDLLNTMKNRHPNVGIGIAGPSSKSDPHMAREGALRQAIEDGIIEQLRAEPEAKDVGDAK